MYAIVNIAGQQFKVEKEQKLFVHRLADKEGDTVRFDEVLLIDNDKSVVVGEPTIKGAMITGKVISHPKADKVQVFKKKRRKGYKVLRGHRQQLTEIQIEDIIEKGAVKEAKPKAASKPAPKAAAKAEPKAEGKAKAAASEKKAAEKAPAKKAARADKAKTKPAADKKTAAKPAAKKSSGTAKAAPKKPAAGDKDK